ncbi:MAG: hypothetical protein ABSA79_03960 [Candidatus Bathyarchaeia archaeon]|jgi:hypothetical protein
MAKVNIIPKKWKVFMASIFITIFLFVSILIIGAWHLEGVKNFYMNESSEPTFSFFQITTTGSNYFFPNGIAHFSLSNPYSDEIKDFHFYVSFDNQSWVELPVSNTTNYVQAGETPVGMDINVFTMSTFPSQNTTLPINSSFQFSFFISPIMTPETIVIMIVLIIAIFSFTLQILEYIFLKGS